MKITIRFYIDKSKTNKKGKSVIKCRITYNKNRKEFSTGLFINPSFWYSKEQTAKPPNEENSLINKQLSLIENKIRQAFLMLQIQTNPFTVDDIYKIYKGVELPKETKTVAYFKTFLNKIEKLIEIEIKYVTWIKYEQTYKHIANFIKWKFKQQDILLNNIESSFLADLDYYLKTEKQLQQVTINKVIQRFKRVIKEALAERILNVNPFLLYKPKRVFKQVIFLTTDELKTLEIHQFVQPRLQEVKDWFVFSCYTGLAYNEIKNLRKQHIVTGFDGELWIEMKREKTQKNISVPLLPKAKELIDKYADDNSEKVFNVCSNQRYNSYLKEIASILGITKRLTTHTARKTFASTVLLYNDVPMEIVSQLLGHSSITITEDSYGKVVQKKVSEQMRKLNIKLLSFIF